MKHNASRTTFINARYICLQALLCVLVLAVISRLSYLHIVKQNYLHSQGAERAERSMIIPAYRGMIKDRHGEALAVSTPIDSVWANPKELNIEDPQLLELAKVLELSFANLQHKLTSTSREFVYLQRHITPETSAKVKKLAIGGVNITNEYRRYYPAGAATAHVLGFTDIDDHGQEGLELSYDSWLAGTPGKRKIVCDNRGRAIQYLPEIHAANSGKDLQLSIDQRLQYIAYRSLKSAVVANHASSGSAVVLDVHSGEVLAMLNEPSYNPNQRKRDGGSAVYRNLAVTDYFEPGSVIKAFSMASVLENTNISPSTVINTNPGYMRLQGGVIRDVTDNGYLEVGDILMRSSNIGISKLVLNLEPQTLWDSYDRFGFGWQTGSNFPGESSGVLELPNADQKFVMATMAFGYGLGVTPLQLARAYAVLGAEGVRRPVTFLKQAEPVMGYQVIQPEVARQVVSMLAAAANHAKSNARVVDYQVAGKTGTVRQIGKDGYEQARHRTVYGGLAPAINPKFAIVVTVNEPQAGKYYGNQVAAPVFAKIASEALRLYNIAPDIIDTHGVKLAQNGNIHS